MNKLIELDKQRLDWEKQDKIDKYKHARDELAETAALYLAAYFSRFIEKIKTVEKYAETEATLLTEDIKRNIWIINYPEVNFINFPYNPFYPLLTATYRTNKFIAVYEFPQFLQKAISNYYDYDNLLIALTSLTRQITGIGNLKLDFKTIDSHSGLLTMFPKLPNFLQKIDYSGNINITFKSPVAIQSLNNEHLFIGYLPLFWKHYFEIIADVIEPSTFQRNVKIPLPLDGINFAYLLQIVIIGDFILLQSKAAEFVLDTKTLPDYDYPVNFVYKKLSKKEEEGEKEKEGIVLEKNYETLKLQGNLQPLIVIPMIFYNLILYPTQMSAIDLNYAGPKDFSLTITNQCLYYDIVPVFLFAPIQFVGNLGYYSHLINLRIPELIINFIMSILLYRDLIKLPR